MLDATGVYFLNQYDSVEDLHDKVIAATDRWTCSSLMCIDCCCGICCFTLETAACCIILPQTVEVFFVSKPNECYLVSIYSGGVLETSIYSCIQMLQCWNVCAELHRVQLTVSGVTWSNTVLHRVQLTVTGFLWNEGIIALACPRYNSYSRFTLGNIFLWNIFLLLSLSNIN